MNRMPVSFLWPDMLWLLLLLLLAAAENEIKQVFGRTHLRRQRHGASDGGSHKHAAQLALKG